MLTARSLDLRWRGVAALLFTAGAAPGSAAERSWIEMRTPHFVVIANTGEGDARDVGFQFEQVRSAFQLLWPWATRQTGRPFVVFALRSERDLKALAPKYWENRGDGASAVSASGRDKDYFAVRTDLREPDSLRRNPYYLAYWGYTIQGLDAVFPGRLPPWLRRGLAEFFGNTLVQSKQVHVGRIVDHHVRTLAGPPRMSLAEILGADAQSRWLTDEDRRRSFDAHAWILVHYLTLGEKQQLLPKFNRFSERLRQGQPAGPAFAEELGDLAALSRGFDYYRGGHLYTYVVIKTDVNVKPEGFTVRTLPPAEAAARRAGFLTAMRRPAEARALLAEARQADPSSLPADEVEALLLEDEDKKEEALALYTRAARAGSDNFYVHYRRGSLLRRPNPQKEVLAEMSAAFAEAVRLNPEFAWGQAAWARVLAELEPGERAVEAARRAVALEPTTVAHRLALIKALSTAGRSDEAKREAEASLKLAQDEEDRKDVQEWLDYMARASEKPAPARSAAQAGPPRGGADWMQEASKACESGTSGACGALASAYHTGTGVTKDVGRALALLEKACDLGELRGCAYAGRLKLEGREVPKDVPGATRLATKACEGGAMEGCTTLAVLHASRGTRPEMDRARALLDQACRGGESNACSILQSFPK